VSNSETYDPSDGVAIIGMAGRFPGAPNVSQFWHNLLAGVESVSFFAEHDLDLPSSDARLASRDPHYVRARGVLEDVDMFDAAFFGIIPKEAEIIDPQQRVFLETAWAALEDAGHDPQSYPGSIGVFAGMSNNTYFLANLQGRRDVTEVISALVTMMGNEKDYLATRVSYKLDLRGPSINVQTACSTSLVAVCQAYQSLMSYQCDMALAGGVSITLPQKRGYLYQEDGIVSPDGHCRAFDAQSGGTVFGNGVGIVVLKRLPDALSDGDSIYAVIKGAALNNDGSSKVSFTAPSVDGHAEVIAMAQALAGIDPETISYVEAHGTGTALGDPIEIAGLTQAFRAGTASTDFCGIGSVKTNIGHLDAAAGVAGLIKAALALKFKELPASLHFQTPNPRLDLENSPFHVVTSRQEWPAGPTPRRAGVSSFGVGGTNAHVVLEEAPPAGPGAPSRDQQLLLLSARSSAALDRATENLRQHLEDHPEVELASVAYTLQAGRRRFGHRRALVCGGRDDALDALRTLDPRRVVTDSRERRDPSVAFMFPGQGAQYVGMTRDLYHHVPSFKTQVSECAEVLLPHLGHDLRDILYPDPAHATIAEQQLVQTAMTQPALFVVEYALARLWMTWGVQPHAMVGHSLGEYVAACLAGVFSRDDALTLLAGRARLMQGVPTGAMLAVRLPAAEVESLLDEHVSVAAINGPSLTVVSGPQAAVEALQVQLAEREIACRLLPTSHAFHSAMVDPIVAPFRELVSRVQRHPPRIPWVSGVSGDWVTPAQAVDPTYWAEQLRRPVRFMDGVGKLLADPQRLLLEVGPGSTLSTLAKQHPDRPSEQLPLSSLHDGSVAGSEMAAMLNALGRLWLAGASVDWSEVHAPARGQRIPLPTYPFERKRFWVAPEAPADGSNGRGPASPGGADAAAALVEKSLPAASHSTHDGNTMNAQARSDRSDSTPDLLPRLQSLFADLSGMDVADLTPTTPFLELGFDSLFLTQVSTAIKKTFGATITFRELFEDLSTLASLAARLADTLPPPEQEQAHSSAAAARPGGPEEVRQDVPAPRSLPASGNATPTSLPGDDEPSALPTNALERIMAQQLAVMSSQLELLRGGGVNVAPAVVSGGPSGRQPRLGLPDGSHVSRHEPSTPGPQPAGALTGALPAPAVQQANGAAPTAFGPYRPIARGTLGGLTPRQQRHADGLIARYTARTRESKRLTELHRPHLADPRSVAGFRMAWKEIVYPIVVARSSGSRLWDVDGNEYVDLVNGFGMNLFGHSPPFVTAALEAQLRLGMEIGPQSPLTGKVADLVCDLTGMERVAFCNTGSEAVMAALRVARTVTGRDKIVIFAGAYHGIFDEVLVRATTRNGLPSATPIAPGIPVNAVDNVLVLEYGSPGALEVLAARGHELAAVLVEPVQSRRPELQPREFLRDVRRLTAASGAALIFDEVVTGFRAHPGGIQALWDIRADLATYGKVVAGGVPIGLLAGTPAFMNALDGGMWSFGDDSFPETGMTFFAGTFVRHPLALAAAEAVLHYLQQQGPELQRQLDQRTARLVETLVAHVERVGAPVRITHFSSWFCVTFPPDVPYASLFFTYMRGKGVHIWEGRAWFLTTAHTDEDLERLVQAFKDSISEMQQADFLPGRALTPPVPGARLGKDQAGVDAWFVPDPARPGKYLQVGE